MKKNWMLFLFFAASAAPVSYTHLDVYKRQRCTPMMIRATVAMISDWKLVSLIK